MSLQCFAVICNEVEMNSHFMRQPGLHPSGFHCLFLCVGFGNVQSLAEADGGIMLGVFFIDSKRHKKLYK